MNKVRIGVIGIGNMGTSHVRSLINREVKNAELTAICDNNPDRLNSVKEEVGDQVSLFAESSELIASGKVDAVVIAVPHYSHPPIAIDAFEHGLHVMTEKPAGVYTKQVREMNESASKSGAVFGIMYNQRTRPMYQKLRELVQSGELGQLKRTNWIVTSWYRPQAYYDSGGWRATWTGEGGGVLINQCPHNLDLWQWTCGMPVKVRSFCGFGKHHNIEVEDDVTAYVEYENGATGVFVTSTADTPGTNRLEVTGDRGKIVIEDNKMTFWRLCQSEREFNSENKIPFAQPEVWKCEIPVEGGDGTEHKGILSNWVDAIQTGSALLAPGEEGIRGLEISNAIHLSAWTDDWVTLPIDEELYYKELQKRVKGSKVKKDTSSVKVTNMNNTFK